jgi:hypothetical protein
MPSSFIYSELLNCHIGPASCSVAVVCICSTALTYHVLYPGFAAVNPLTNLCGSVRSPPTFYSSFYFDAWLLFQSIITYFILSCLMIVCLVGIHFKMRVQRTVVVTLVRKGRVQRQMLILMISSVVCFAIYTLPYSIYRIVSQRVDITSATTTILSILGIF